MTATLPLRRFVRVVNGGTPTADEPNWGGDVQWATPIDLARVDGGFIAQTDRTLTSVGLRQGSASVPAGSILISSRAPIGYTAIAQATMAFNQGCKGLVPLLDVDARFLRYWLQAQRDVLQAAGSGSTFMELSADALMRSPVPNRPGVEQRRIADFLEDQVARIDNIIAARRSQLGLVAETLRTLLDSLFDGRPRPLRTVLAQAPCYGVLVPKFVDDGVPFIRVNDLQRLDDGHELAQVDRGQSIEYRRTVVEEDDVLVSVVGSIDKSAIVSRARAGANVARAVARLRPARSVPSTVIHGWLSTTGYRDQARLATGGDTAQPTLNMGDLSGFRIALPDGDLASLGAKVTDIRERAWDATKMLVASVGLLRELKRSLITAAVTGDGSLRAMDCAFRSDAGGRAPDR